MKKARPNQIALLRCADAAGYAAVSWFDEDHPAVVRRAGAAGALLRTIDRFVPRLRQTASFGAGSVAREYADSFRDHARLRRLK